MPAFYIDLLKTWAEAHDVKSTPLDKHIREALFGTRRASPKQLEVLELKLYLKKIANFSHMTIFLETFVLPRHLPTSEV